MRKTSKPGRKKAPSMRAAGEGYVLVKKEFLDELLTLKKNLKNMERILKSGIPNSF